VVKNHINLLSLPFLIPLIGDILFWAKAQQGNITFNPRKNGFTYSAYEKCLVFKIQIMEC